MICDCIIRIKRPPFRSKKRPCIGPLSLLTLRHNIRCSRWTRLRQTAFTNFINLLGWILQCFLIEFTSIHKPSFSYIMFVLLQGHSWAFERIELLLFTLFDLDGSVQTHVCDFNSRIGHDITVNVKLAFGLWFIIFDFTVKTYPVEHLLGWINAFFLDESYGRCIFAVFIYSGKSLGICDRLVLIYRHRSFKGFNPVSNIPLIMCWWFCNRFVVYLRFTSHRSHRWFLHNHWLISHFPFYNW